MYKLENDKNVEVIQHFFTFFSPFNYYNNTGDKMIIYIDLIFLLNVLLDFILLMGVSVILTRNASIKKIILGSIIGGVSTLILFISISNIVLIFLKIILGILMVIITFGYKDIKYTLNNLFYLLSLSFSIGGVLYLLMDKDYYNYLILIIIFIIVCFLYVRQMKKIKNKYTNYYKVDIYYNKKVLSLVGYLDTGNYLYDNYKHRPIILIDKKIKCNLEDIIYVSYSSLNNESVLKCLKVEKVIINNHVFKNYLIGLSNKKINIDGINCILHSKMKGMI